ncbi:calcium-binding protein [Microvirga terricola]|uniref:Calcium-binding protein n=1 Tax=Microvirga terricola TaxID=2719797 RepID=A0ABX0VC66_9HYPH|nr:calcium-binding protein [Microvirga terricola]NIX76744.1 calcium-binding protein [Microvirga terricola]
MATVIVSVDDAEAVDLSLFFPGLVATAPANMTFTSTSAHVNYSMVRDGVYELGRAYEIIAAGKLFHAASEWDAGIGGVLSSAVLAVHFPDVLLPRQLAHMTFELGENTSRTGGIGVSGIMDMTPDTLLRRAFNDDVEGAKLILNGGLGNDTLPGSDHRDTLNGGAGADLMIGRGGSDRYVVDNAFDTIVELAGGGYDTAITKVSYQLGVNTHVEELVADTAAGGISLAGNELSNRLVGNDFSNVLDGGGSSDTLVGGLGDDIYKVDNAFDIVVEIAGEGTDTVISSISYTVGAAASIEVLQTANANDTSAISLTGNAFANVITGNAGANRLSGEAGDDRLVGGLGNDILTGGSGKDVFVFSTKPNKAKNLDRITDYNVVDDSIWLDDAVFKGLGSTGSIAKPAKLKSAAFWVGAQAHDSSDRIIYNKASGALFYDADGTGKIAPVMIAQLTKNLKMTAADFFVI